VRFFFFLFPSRPLSQFEPDFQIGALQSDNMLSPSYLSLFVYLSHLSPPKNWSDDSSRSDFDSRRRKEIKGDVASEERKRERGRGLEIKTCMWRKENANGRNCELAAAQPGTGVCVCKMTILPLKIIIKKNELFNANPKQKSK
jgi:hypothetical protein